MTDHLATADRSIGVVDHDQYQWKISQIQTDQK